MCVCVCVCGYNISSFQSFVYYEHDILFNRISEVFHKNNIESLKTQGVKINCLKTYEHSFKKQCRKDSFAFIDV